jgi:hypothetical protein
MRSSRPLVRHFLQQLYNSFSSFMNVEDGWEYILASFRGEVQSVQLFLGLLLPPWDGAGIFG